MLPTHLDVQSFTPKVMNSNVTVSSGAKLLADGKTMEEFRQVDQRAVVADQESWGFADSFGVGSWWAVIRGVSDFGDPEKSDEWQFLAASTATLCLKNFLEKEYLPPSARR